MDHPAPSLPFEPACAADSLPPNAAVAKRIAGFLLQVPVVSGGGMLVCGYGSYFAPIYRLGAR